MPLYPTLVSPAEVNAMAFIVPIDESYIKLEFIAAAEEKYLVPIMGEQCYIDMALNPMMYGYLIDSFIKSFLAFATKRLLYSQYITENSYQHDTLTTFPLLTEPSRDILTADLQALDDIIEAKGKVILAEMMKGAFPYFYNSVNYDYPRTLVDSREVNSLAFIIPIDESYILPSIITAAEQKFLIPVITQVVYDDIFLNPAIYTQLLSDYIKPYLAFCTKLLLYNQYFSETPAVSAIVPLAPLRLDDLKDLSNIITVKRQILEQHLSTDEFPLFVLYSKPRINGFLISE